MPYELVISRAAFEDIDEAFTYYEQELAGLGERFLENLESAYQKLALRPQHFGFIDANKSLRDVSIDQFPFVVIFQIHLERVLILRVFHTSRNPRSLKFR